MQTYEAVKTPESATGTVHVALLDGDGIVIIHEELPAADAVLRHHMLELQAELDVRDIPGSSRQVYHGDVWPPEGHELSKGKVVPVKAEP